MRKFVNTQRLRNESVLANTQLLSLLPSDSFQRLPTLTTAASLEEEEILRLLTLSSTPLNSISSFESSSATILLPPLRNDVFTSELIGELKVLYEQLYPQREFTSFSPFFSRSGRGLHYTARLLVL